MVATLLSTLAMFTFDVGQYSKVARIVNDASCEGARQSARNTLTNASEVEAIVQGYLANAMGTPGPNRNCQCCGQLWHTSTRWRSNGDRFRFFSFCSSYLAVRHCSMVGGIPRPSTANPCKQRPRCGETEFHTPIQPLIAISHPLKAGNNA